MKKIFMAIALCLVCATTINAQLSVSTTQTNNDFCVMKDAFNNSIRVIGDDGVIKIKDFYSNQYITIKLGSTAQSIQTSLQQIVDWGKTAKPKDYFNIIQDDIEITIYKTGDNRILFSDGGFEYIRVRQKQNTLAVLVGTNVQRKYDDALLGGIYLRKFEEALETFTNLINS